MHWRAQTSVAEVDSACSEEPNAVPNRRFLETSLRGMESGEAVGI
ncbi:hypothetical protein [Thermomicrobium sp.]